MHLLPFFLGTFALISLSIVDAKTDTKDKQSNRFIKKNAVLSNQKSKDLTIFISSGSSPILQASIPVCPNITSTQVKESNAKNANKFSNLCFFGALSGSTVRCLSGKRDVLYVAPPQQDIEKFKEQLAQERIGRTERDTRLQAAVDRNERNKLFSDCVNEYEDSVRNAWMVAIGVLVGARYEFASNVVTSLGCHFLYNPSKSGTNRTISGDFYVRPEFSLGYQFSPLSSVKVVPFLSSSVLAKITPEEPFVSSSAVLPNPRRLVPQLGVGVTISYKDYFLTLSGQVDLKSSVLLQPENQKKFGQVRFAGISAELGVSW